MSALKNALITLKTLKASYTTASDPMIADITSNYGKATDRVSGYGSVKNADDKDGKINRFKKGTSTLLDKTIYIQAAEGSQAQLESYKKTDAPVVDGAALETAKLAVVDAINALAVSEEPAAPTVEPAKETSPQTSDAKAVRLFAGMAGVAATIGAVVFFRRKSEELCEEEN